MAALEDFLRTVEEVASGVDRYRTGGIGKDGTCDCVGLIMGALYRLGARECPYHSSNWFARYRIANLTPISSEAHVYAGMIVLKATEDRSNLNERYLPGGSCYTGDLLDYYHVGVVMCARPLRILHCSISPNNGINEDTKLKGWNYGGMCTDVHYGGKKGTNTETAITATVVLAQGCEGRVNLRKTPGGALVDRMDPGDTVTVTKDEGLWCLVRWKGKTGYVKSDFLEYGDNQDETVEPPEDASVDVDPDQRLQLREACDRLDSISSEIAFIRSVVAGILGGDAVG